MKKTDIAMIVLIAGVGVLVAYLVVSNISFLKLPEDGVKVQTAPVISSEVKEPSKTIFHTDAINPTVEVIVGNGGAN